jgi:triosephosphate isomerase
LAISSGLKVIFCIGESLEERKAGRTLEILKRQLSPLLKAFNKDSPHWFS